MDLKDVDSDELENRVKVLVSRMNDTAQKVGPLLADYGNMRKEAEHIAGELRRRGIIKDV